MSENLYHQRKIRPMHIATELNKNSNNNNGAQISQNFLPNTMNTRQPLNQSQSTNHIQQNILPHLVNLISPQISATQPGNQPMLNMGFNATPFLQNHLYSLPNSFGSINPMSSQGYNPGNVSYMNNIRVNNGVPSQSVVNYKEPKMGHINNDSNGRKLKVDLGNNNKVSNYPVRLLVNSELVGPLIGRKGEKIKEITASTGAKIDIKRESVPYSQFGLNNYMFSGCNRKGSGSGDNDHIVTANNHSNRGESQIVFIIGEPEKCTAAIQEIMQLCTQEATEQGREEPNLGLLAEDRFCARIIGKEGRYLNFVRCKSSSQVHVSNVPTITTLSQQPHIISLDRIISCRGGGLVSLLEAEKLISEKIRQCVAEDNQNSTVQKPFSKMSKDDTFLPPRAAGEMTLFNPYFNNEMLLPSSPRRPQGIIGSGIVHKANPNWPENLKLDENLYVRIPQLCAGSIIGSEGKSVKRIMSETGTYIQISKTNLSPIESVPAVHTYRKQAIPSCGGSFLKEDQEVELDQRLVTIKGGVPSQCSALAHIFNRIKICYNQSSSGVTGGDNPANHHDFHDVRLWVVLRVPKIMLGRLIGKDGKVIRQLQLNSRTFLSFPRLKVLGQDDDEVNEIDSEVKEEKVIEEADPPRPFEGGLQNPDSAIFGDPDLHPVEIFGQYDAVECAVFMIRRLVYSCIFTQYGPALIPGPASSSPSMAHINGSQLMQQHPAFLLSPPSQGQMLQWQRRQAPEYFTNPHYYGGSIPNMPRVFGPPGVPSLPPSLQSHINPAKIFKRQPHFIQRGKNRPQSENKNQSRQDGADNEDTAVTLMKEEEFGCHNDDSGEDLEYNCDTELPLTSPKRLLTIPCLEPLASNFSGPDSLLISPSQRFQLSSPCSTYYTTGCSPASALGNNHFNTSTTTTLDDLSFITAQDSLADSSFTAEVPQTTTAASFSHWSSQSPPHHHF